ncbi:MAG: EAL domain-containing protein [Phascolarctobacterium sp.]|uniref:sensor domain-containing phosphodiesterase n=2 Tax=Phascolarctobacterium faecium TaxID=33025 RepID=UPI001B6190DB|nr:EAL domain-containing protein [Phascolarctobacterium faecium]MBP8592664.1 EAL domain-containing protein [Phascolarctobacterium sp.]MED9992267.1 EAL domain-containing protein [Phascolarctobacterium faecium]
MKRDINTLSLLNEISELVYVSDPETYELLFVNQTGCQTLHLENYKHKKCYEVLQGKTSPCEFCTNDRLCDDNFYTWEFTNPSIGRHFLLKDKIIQWHGKTARMEIAFDITERELQKQELKNMLDVQTLITNCVRMLYAVDDLDQTINAVLTQIGEFLVSDRAYVFEIKDELMNNTHEWTAPGISPQLEKLQQLDLSLISDWLPFFEKNDCIIIDDVEQLQKTNPAAYATLHAQEITSLIAAPIFLDNKLAGYIGIDNYDSEKIKNSSYLLLSMSIFLSYAIRHRNHVDMLHRLSYHDLLTNALNRNAFMDVLSQFRPGQYASAGIIYIDINGMKEINDFYGHHQGDKILITTVAKVFNLFKPDELFRIGGDEFVIITYDLTETDFYEKFNLLRNIFCEKTNLPFSIATGSCWVKSPSDLNSLLQQADSAMYTDKKKFYYGKEKTSRYRHNLDDILNLANYSALQEALTAGQFCIYFQPKISLDTEEFIGSEALIRYINQAGEIIAPNNFIPILEEARLIKMLDLYVFEEVCKQINIWKERKMRVKPVSINLSRSTLSYHFLADQLLALITKHNIDISLLELEVTETAEVDNQLVFSQALEKLKEYGFSISIDDFGVRNASLSLFTTINFDILKLDRSLVKTLAQNQKARILIRSLAVICSDLGIKLIAEGVETLEQLDILKELRCNEVQGYLFSKPLPLNDFENKYLQILR